jgi:hypothetical protein
MSNGTLHLISDLYTEDYAVYLIMKGIDLEIVRHNRRPRMYE